MMGTHAQPGYSPDYAKLSFAAEVAKRTGPDDFVIVHDNLPRRVEFYYYVDRSNTIIAHLAQLPALLKQHPRSVVLMDAYPAPAEMRLAPILERARGPDPARRRGPARGRLVPRTVGVLNVGLQAQGVAQTRLGNQIRL